MASSACLHAQPKSFSASFNGLTRTETDIFSSLVVLPPPPVPMTCVCVCVYRAREKILSAAKMCDMNNEAFALIFSCQSRLSISNARRVLLSLLGLKALLGSNTYPSSSSSLFPFSTILHRTGRRFSSPTSSSSEERGEEEETTRKPS